MAAQMGSSLVQKIQAAHLLARNPLCAPRNCPQKDRPDSLQHAFCNQISLAICFQVVQSESSQVCLRALKCAYSSKSAEVIQAFLLLR